MRFEIVVAPQASDTDAAPPRPAPVPARPEPAPRRRRAPPPARALLDVFVDGANVTARVKETHGAFVLRDLALSLVELAARPRGKAAVRFYDEPWEMCVERFGATACVSVYLAGAEPLVAVHDRAVPFADVVAAVREAIDRVLAEGAATRRGRGRLDAAARIELASAAEQLRDVPPSARDRRQPVVPELVAVVVEPERDAPLSFGADFGMRVGADAAGADARVAVERADLHALLFRGRVRAEIRGRAVDLGECHPMLVAERLVELARRAFDAWERGLALHARGEAAGVLVGVRVARDGQLALTLGGSQGGARRAVHTFPALGVADVLEAALAFGRSLVRAILRRDRSQGANLRLAALRRALREGTEALREASNTDSKVNPTPEPYRAFAAAIDEAPGGSRVDPSRARRPPPLRLALARHRPGHRSPRDLPLRRPRAIVGAASEMWALDRASGRVLWRVDVARGTSVVTPGGIALLGPDGTLCVHDFGNGEITLRTRIAARVGGPVAGAVVHLPGLPKLVVVTEGEHHLVAIDLTSGEARWRWSWGPRGMRDGVRAAPRMKRAGRLLYVTSGDSALTALDVMTGAVVWRLRDRLRFRTPPTVAHDTLYVVAGGAHGVARLYCVDPFSGHVRWSSAVADPTSPCTVEGPPLVADGAVAVPVRQKSGLALATPSAAPTARPMLPRGARHRPERHLVARRRRRVHRQHADRRAHRGRRRRAGARRAPVAARARRAPARGRRPPPPRARASLRRAVRPAHGGRHCPPARRRAPRPHRAERGHPGSPPRRRELQRLRRGRERSPLRVRRPAAAVPRCRRRPPSPGQRAYHLAGRPVPCDPAR